MINYHDYYDYYCDDCDDDNDCGDLDPDPALHQHQHLNQSPYHPITFIIYQEAEHLNQPPPSLALRLLASWGNPGDSRQVPYTW